MTVDPLDSPPLSPRVGRAIFAPDYESQRPSLFSGRPVEVSAAQLPLPDYRGGGDVLRDYWYLCGPMSNKPKFNIPRMIEVANRLRSNGFNIVNPAELNRNLQLRERYLASEDGSDFELTTKGPQGIAELLEDLKYVSSERCVGLICIEGWEQSSGARVETCFAQEIDKELLRYDDTGRGTAPFTLSNLDRDKALLESRGS
jgi:hypothetical protein